MFERMATMCELRLAAQRLKSRDCGLAIVVTITHFFAGT